MTSENALQLVDSHCHLNRLDLTDFGNDMKEVIRQAASHGVSHMLCVCVEQDDIPVLQQLTQTYPMVSMSVGIHPDTEASVDIDAERLVDLAKAKRCIAIGETGLDYYRVTAPDEQLIQQQRFREHIRAAIQSKKPLIIHTRQAASDTLRLMKEEKAETIGGVMHCFTEDWEVARQALDCNFYISFSGVVTFKNALQIQEVAKKVPLDRILIETDAPYLAPVPFRGKQNHPALVSYVAEKISELRQIDVEVVARETTKNFYDCFRVCGHLL